MRPRAPADLAVAVFVAAGIAVVLVAIWRPASAAQGWLAAYLFWAGLPIGALFLVLVHGLTGGAWGLTLRPALAGMLRAMPLLALFLIPVLVAERLIYPWAAGGRGWLDPLFFALRAVVYVVLWNALALVTARRARPDGGLPPGFAWPALILLFVSTSLAAFDWLMTLEPRWVSTIYGLLVTTGWALDATAAAIAVTALYTPPASAETLDAPARILLALVFLWAYLATVQLIVIWESDLGAEIPWYLRRLGGGWQWVGLFWVVLQFAVPFLVLMWRNLRRSRAAVLAAALSAVAAHLAETWWLSVPDFSRGFGWAEPLAAAAIGAAFLFVGAGGFGSRRVLPTRPGDAGE